MELEHHPICNDVLLAPPGSVNVVDLPIWRGKRSVAVPGGDVLVQNVVVSFWRPSEEELRQLNERGCVSLHVWGATFPPVQIGVEP